MKHKMRTPTEEKRIAEAMELMDQTAETYRTSERIERQRKSRIFNLTTLKSVSASYRRAREL